MKRSAQLNSLTGLCLTKLDVLDGLEKIGICFAYQYQGKEIHNVPIGAESFGQCTPVIEEVDGWKESTVGITAYEDLPLNAKRYIQRIEEMVGVPVHILSTGPERKQTVLLTHPFE
jgi:adenylosuccinate synthase